MIFDGSHTQPTDPALNSKHAKQGGDEGSTTGRS